MTDNDEAGTDGSKPVRRRGRPRKNAATDNASPELDNAVPETLAVREADAEMLQQRKAANPRETAKAGDDMAYD